MPFESRPMGVPIKLTMTSEDVVHSFYVPAFRVKQDVIPGRYTSVWFEATKTGTYHLFCAEYCGAEHSLMIGKIHVMEPADYEAWLEGIPARLWQVVLHSWICGAVFFLWARRLGLPSGRVRRRAAAA